MTKYTVEQRVAAIKVILDVVEMPPFHKFLIQEVHDAIKENHEDEWLSKNQHLLSPLHRVFDNLIIMPGSESLHLRMLEATKC